MCSTYISNFSLDSYSVAQSCRTLCDPMKGSAWKAPLFMGFSRQEYWSGLLFPSPGDVSDQGIESTSPISQVDFFFFNHWAIEIIFNQVVERLHFSILNKNNLNAEWSIDYCKVKCQHKVDINDFLYVEGQFSYHSIIKYIILLNIKKVDKLPIRRTFCPSNKCVHLCVWTDEASRGSSIKLQSILKTLAKWFLFWII